MIMTASIQDMIDSVKTDSLSVGLCCHRYAYDPLTRLEIAGIKDVPLDSTGNGMLEGREKFSGNLDRFQRAIWLGKYPCRSFQEHNLVALEQPMKKTYIKFMKWALTEEQQLLHEEGFVSSRTRALNQEIRRLNELVASLGAIHSVPD